MTIDRLIQLLTAAGMPEPEIRSRIHFDEQGRPFFYAAHHPERSFYLEEELSGSHRNAQDRLAVQPAAGQRHPD